MNNQEKEVLQLKRKLENGTYKPGGYKVIEIFDPKHRLVSAAPFRDRVVHHALIDVCAPIFERGFVYDSYANRTGKGSHRAVARYEQFRDRFRFVLRCDIYRYFPTIDHEILKRDIRRRIACVRTLDLIDLIIDSSNPQEPVVRYFPGDTILTQIERRRGIPIGNLTSQFFANLYLDRLDHFCKEVLQAKGYVRYVDDIALFHSDEKKLSNGAVKSMIFWHIADYAFTLLKHSFQKPRKSAFFLGFELLPGSYRRLPEANVKRFRNRLRGLRDRCRARTVACAEVNQRIQSWIAHAEHADTWRLRQAIFRNGMFDPFREPDHPPVHACCAAGPGTTNRGTYAPQIATGTQPRTVTTTTGFELPYV